MSVPIKMYAYKKISGFAMCGSTRVIPALRRQRQEDGEFQSSPGNIVRPCLKKKVSFKKYISDRQL
jgi:hypothetical protein